MIDPFPWLSGELEQLRDAQLIRRRRRVKPLADGWCEVDGRRLRNFASNDYLNLAHDSRLKKAASDALKENGVGARASALVAGRTDWHVKLEEQLARFEHQEAALLFPTGYAANMGTVAALAGKGDIVYSDELNHASLIDGCRLSRADVRVYPHNDVLALEQELKSSPGNGRRLIVSDGLFSMDGDVAHLPKLCDLAERFEAALLVDEAHATGVLGDHGRGVAECQDVENRVSVRVGTLSKAVGTMGGFVTGSRELIDWLWNRARSQIYSTALPPAMCAAACAAFNIIETEPWRRTQLAASSNQLRAGLLEMGLSTTADSVGPIVPIVLNDPQAAVAAQEQLAQQGFFTAAIRPPTVPRGTSRLRITISCAQTPEDISRLLEALSNIVAVVNQ